MGAYVKNNWKWLVGIFASDIVTFFSYPPHELGWIMFVGLVPVFIAMEQAPTWKQAAFRTWLYVFLGNAAICIWVAYSVSHFADVSILVGYPAVIVLSIVEQGAWPVLTALRHILHKRFGVRPILWTPAALLFLDVCWPKFFPNTMGNVFYQIPWLCQVADITGVWGLTALIGMSNELVAMLILKSWPRRELVKHTVVSVAVLASAFAYGTWRYGQVHELMKSPQSHLHVAMVQPNINASVQIRKAQDKQQEQAVIFNQMSDLTIRAKQTQPDLIIWPETSYPDTYHGESARENRLLTSSLDALIVNQHLSLIFGGRDQVGHDRYNSLFYVTPDKREVYHKTLLLELSEHVPLSGLFPDLAEFAKARGKTAFANGSGPTVFDGPKATKFGVMICLEGLYARFVRSLANAHANILVNITNDAWFGDSMEPDLHLYLTAFRSIETRRPLIRTTNTGYSAIVDIDGSLRLKSKRGVEQILDDEVPIYPEIQTPFMVIGDIFIILCGLYMIAPFVWLIWRRRARAKKV